MMERVQSPPDEVMRGERRAAVAGGLRVSGVCGDAASGDGDGGGGAGNGCARARHVVHEVLETFWEQCGDAEAASQI